MGPEYVEREIKVNDRVTLRVCMPAGADGFTGSDVDEIAAALAGHLLELEGEEKSRRGRRARRGGAPKRRGPAAR